MGPLRGEEFGLYCRCADLYVGVGSNRLNLVVMRLANVYGEYGSKVIATMLCMARVYAYLKDEMKWLWTKDLRSHTVHVTDAARALWHAADWYTHGKKNWDESWGSVPIFNIVDHGDTCSLPFSQVKLYKN